jgi:hypothetical protein
MAWTAAPAPRALPTLGGAPWTRSGPLMGRIPSKLESGPFGVTGGQLEESQEGRQVVDLIQPQTIDDFDMPVVGRALK